MSKRRPDRSIRHFLLLTLMPVAVAANLFTTPHPADANCAGEPPDEISVPLIQQRWKELLQMQTYPWGTARVYSRLVLDRREIWLDASFNQLRGSHKQQAVEMLQLGSSPFTAYASDGRLVSARYDGCTRFDTLTERARFSWYYSALDRSLPANTARDLLRNVDRPAWRQVRYRIAAAQERSVRTLFWNQIGYAQASKGMWIAWVPEHGYFEINVPNGYNVQQLRRFWGLAPRQYRYIVVQSDGTQVFDANFDG